MCARPEKACGGLTYTAEDGMKSFKGQID